jgi:photosystem II stability/assembly factor-like uncharacterized protein
MRRLLTVALLSITPASFASAPRWIQATPFGGNILALAQAPSSPRMLYAVAQPGGLFRSLDGGATWNQRTGGPAGETIADLVVETHDPQTVYALTGATSKASLLRTRDGGQSWSEIGPDWSVYALVVDRQNPGVLYAGTWLGLLRSLDGGDSWEVAAFGDGLVTALAIDPLNAATLWAAVRMRGSDDASRVWKSGDRGKTWVATSLAATPLGTAEFWRLVIDPVRPGTAYAVSSAELEGAPGLFRTTDGGVSWSLLSAAIGVHDLVASPDGGLFAASDFGVARSSDLGETWMPALPVSSPAGAVPEDAIFRLLVSVRSPQTLFAAGGEGVWKTTSGGASWDAANQGLAALGAYSVGVAPVGPATVVALVGQGVFRSADEGRSWKLVNSGFGGLQPYVINAFDPRHPRTIYGFGSDGQADVLLKSTNGGRDWHGLPAGFGCGGDSICDVSMTGFAIDPETPDTLLVGGSYYFHFSGGGYFLLRSNDGGDTWHGLTNLKGLQALAIDREQANLVYGLTCEAFFQSYDAGVTWRAAGHGLPKALCPGVSANSTLTLDHQRPGFLYVGTAGQGVFVSANHGRTFHPMNSGLESAKIATLLVDPESSAKLYAGVAGQGVFRWNASQGGWTPLNGGLPVGDFAGVVALDPQHPSILYAGTLSHGVFRLDLAGSDPGVEEATNGASPAGAAPGRRELKCPDGSRSQRRRRSARCSG